MPLLNTVVDSTAGEIKLISVAGGDIPLQLTITGSTVAAKPAAGEMLGETGQKAAGQPPIAAAGPSSTLPAASIFLPCTRVGPVKSTKYNGNVACQLANQPDRANLPEPGGGFARGRGKKSKKRGRKRTARRRRVSWRPRTL